MGGDTGLGVGGEMGLGGPYVSDQAGLNRGPLIPNIFIVTLYMLFVRIE